VRRYHSSVIAALNDHLPEITLLCRVHGVKSLYLFGSGARDDFDPARSDLDFLVEFECGDPGPWMRRVFALQSALEQLVQRPVDLHLASAVKESRRGRAIEASMVPLYAAA
jgi:predicted nucleotidyltransferase